MNMGIWIDHRSAVLVAMDGLSTTVSRLESAFTRRIHSTGGWRSGGTSVAQCISNEQRTDERRRHQLHAFYKAVIRAASAAENLFIFGPAEARCELAREIRHARGPHPSIAGVEACDKIGGRQIVAKVREFFAR